MKKIACFIENNKHYKLIKDFCKKEDFEIYDLSKNDFVYDLAIVVIITDNYQKIKHCENKDIPICIINQTNETDIFYYKLNKDFDLLQVRALIDNIYQGGVLASFYSSTKLNAIQKNITIKNDISNIDKIVNSFTKELVYFFSISNSQKIRIAISEIITNAIEHGNLAISGDEKFEATENGTYNELLSERLEDERYKDRKVTVDFQIDNKRLSVTIEDEGSGFSVDSINTGNDPEDLLKLHGRGILITKMYFDEIIYNDKGNKVTLIKEVQ